MNHPPPTPKSQPWSEALEELHEESSRTHFIDILTRSAMLRHLGSVERSPTIIDVGCSTGYLLEDLRAQLPQARLVGVDYILSGLHKAQTSLSDCLLAQADAQRLPLVPASASVIVSANLLEHVPDDVAALEQMYEAVHPGGRVVLVVPSGQHLYDYYDRFLHHQRRYESKELASKARSVGFDVLEDFHLGSLIYPAFWLVKKRNRFTRNNLSDKALKRQVTRDIEHTKDSRLGRLASRLELALLDRSVKFPFGVRELVVARRPV